MESTGLSPQEFWHAVHACRCVRVAGSPPAYVQALLSHVLAVLHPPLVAKVARLPPAQMQALRDRIGQLQEDGCPGPAGTPYLAGLHPRKGNGVYPYPPERPRNPPCEPTPT
jgi:hypothetical protein